MNFNPNDEVVTIIGPIPGLGPVTVNGERHLFIDTKNRSLYPERVLRAAVRHFNTAYIPLLYMNGLHIHEVVSSTPVIKFGEVIEALWDPKRFSIIGVVTMTNEGNEYLARKRAIRRNVFLSWDPIVNFAMPLPDGRQIVTDIRAIRSVDVHRRPLTGARFGLTPKIPKPPPKPPTVGQLLRQKFRSR